MSYDLVLKHAHAPELSRGEARVALLHNQVEAATVDLEWDSSQFTGRFIGLASEMPIPAHPLSFIKAVADAINASRVSPGEPISSIFARTNLKIKI